MNEEKEINSNSTLESTDNKSTEIMSNETMTNELIEEKIVLKSTITEEIPSTVVSHSSLKPELTAEQQNSEDLMSDPSHTTVMNLLIKKDDVTWKTIIIELVNSSKMDPWDINISLLMKEYMKVIKTMQNHDFRISGKIILASALLLKLKSARLLEADLNSLDQLFNSTREEEENDLGLIDEILPKSVIDMSKHGLIPRTPMPRTRKISVYDLVNALEKALEVKERRLMRGMPTLETMVPVKRADVTILMNHLLEKITMLDDSGKELIFFTDLAPGISKEEQVITFVPLLHLANSRHIDIEQEKHFGPIQIIKCEKQPILVNTTVAEVETR